MADIVFSFDDGGRLQRLPGLARSLKRGSGSRQLLSAPLHDLKREFDNTQPPPPPLPLAKAPSEDKAIARQKGDYRLYSYYLNSAKRVTLCLFLIAVALAALGERMPRMSVLRKIVTQRHLT